jgi:medium-chain acyl-[acyl-carrier-protein] hydrolase
MARIRLCCFPFAGGGASAFAPWAGALPDWIELWAACLPGREGRTDEPLPSSLGTLARDMAHALEPVAGPTLAFFGHSMGAVLAYEVARSLVASGAREPGCLVLSGRGPPWIHHAPPPPRSLSDEEFAAAVQRRFGGLPDEVFQVPDLLALTVRPLRSDIEMLAAHRALPRPRLSCPVVTCNGRGDSTVTPPMIAAWREATKGPFSIRTFSGGHFYMRPDPAPLVGTLASLLTALPAEVEPVDRGLNAIIHPAVSGA